MITVKQLKECCDKAIKNGYGDKQVYISMDDEGNGYHELFYEFMTKKEHLQMCLDDGLLPYDVKNVDNIVILG